MFPSLQNRFGFTHINCKDSQGMPNTVNYAIHANDLGNSVGVALPMGLPCTHPIGHRDVIANLGKGFELEQVATTSLRVSITRQNSGLVHSVDITLSSPKLILTEAERFSNLTIDTLNSQGEVGSGLSDF